MADQTTPVIKEGQYFYMAFGGAVAPGAVWVRAIGANVERVTPNAVKLVVPEVAGFIWLPKSAIEPAYSSIDGKHYGWRMKHWMRNKLTIEQWRFLERAEGPY